MYLINIRYITNVTHLRNLTPQNFIQGDTIDSASFVYFLMNGTVAVMINDTVSTSSKVPSHYKPLSILAQTHFSIQDGGQREVKRLEKGSYFGELALLTKEPRKATCKVASSDATVGSKFSADPLPLSGLMVHNLCNIQCLT